MALNTWKIGRWSEVAQVVGVERVSIEVRCEVDVAVDRKSVV